MKLLWECDGCGNVVASDPLAHDDTGGVIRVYGPDCEECGGVPMDYIGEGQILPDGSIKIGE